MVTARKRLWGWYAFDWASQPYSTLLMTFIFGPYVTEVLGDAARAQAVWGYGIAAAGLSVALLAPVMGAVADAGGRRVAWVAGFSALYVAGACGTWLAHPEGFALLPVLVLFGLGIVGLELATIFTNALLPSLGARDEVGRISGNGWALGYAGGLVALVAMLLVFAENADGVTLMGTPPPFGLDADAREGTRLVGPLVAAWFVVFMVPFFLWVRDPAPASGAPGVGAALRAAVPALRRTLRALPARRSLAAFLLSSMLSRDALSGFYVFGGVYAAGVLGWSVVDVGVFGILAVVTAAVAAWLGGIADARFGPKPVIVVCVGLLTLFAGAVVFVSREAVLGVAVPPGSRLPDVAFYVLGSGIGAAGGAMQSASRSMMCRLAPATHMTEAFGLYALAGKATSFLAPFLVAVVTDATGSQQAGVVPLVVLFLGGLGLLWFVKPQGAVEEWTATPTPTPTPTATAAPRGAGPR